MPCGCTKALGYGRIWKAQQGDDKILSALDQYLESQSPAVQAVMTGFWLDQQRATNSAVLREALSSPEKMESLFQVWEADCTRFANRKFRDWWSSAARAGAKTSVSLPAFVFDPAHESMQRWLTERAGKLITNLSTTQRESIVAMLQQAHDLGVSTDDLARTIRPSIGLTKRQSKSALKFYQRTRRSLIEQNPDISDQELNRRTNKAYKEYTARQRSKRAADIAITEMADAHNFGAEEAVRQAQERGLIGEVVKRWLTALMDDTCETCSALGAAEPVAFAASFENGGIVCDRPPAHPRCRCCVAYEEVIP